MSTKHLVSPLLAALVVVVVGACAFVNGHRQYSGPLLRRGEVAILADRDLGGITSIVIMSVDSQRAGVDFLVNTNVIELLPGRHVVSLHYVPGIVESVGDVPVEFEALPGHTYVAYGTDNGATPGKGAAHWTPGVEDITDQLSDPRWARLNSGIEQYWRSDRNKVFRPPFGHNR